MNIRTKIRMKVMLQKILIRNEERGVSKLIPQDIKDIKEVIEYLTK